MAERLTNYDPAEDLGSDKAIAVFMAEAFQSNDAAYIAHALGVVARAKGMAQIAGQTGLSREQLYRSFSEKGNPTLKTTLAVMKALGVELSASLSSYKSLLIPLQCDIFVAIIPHSKNSASSARSVKERIWRDPEYSLAQLTTTSNISGPPWSYSSSRLGLTRFCQRRAILHTRPIGHWMSPVIARSKAQTYLL
jgi:probable addiction module antidote protein